jgi:hypothetical protein
MVPAPSFNVPFHSADDVRIAMFASLMNLYWFKNMRTPYREEPGRWRGSSKHVPLPFLPCRHGISIPCRADESVWQIAGKLSILTAAL